MSGKKTTEIGSSCSSGRTSRIKNGELCMVKCFHELPVVHQICRRPPNKGRKFLGCPLRRVGDDCGYFKWDEEVKISIGERNKILEQRIEELVVADNEKMGIELGNLKANKRGKNIKDEDNSDYTWNVREEISILRMKIAKEKQKRVVEVQLKSVREELMALDLKCSHKDKVIFCMTVIVIVLVIARFM